MNNSVLKKMITPVILSSFVVLLCGCFAETNGSGGTTGAGAASDYPNLNMTNTIYREYKPDSGKWQVIQYRLVDLAEDAAENLPAIVSALGADFRADDAYYLAVEPMEEGATHLITIPFDEVHEKTANSILNYVVYDTEDLCVYFDSGRGMTYLYPGKLLEK
ncbi:MAG: hypothetical protein IKN24_01350, partial [Lachnospiraceae bacterium]|nr:hypothetical protein [Lachnospiraceae bacterium]